MSYAVRQTKIEGIDVFVLSDLENRSEAWMAPSLGNNCFRFTREIDGEVIEIIESPPTLETLKTGPASYGNPILFPFPNRIRGGEFTFNGKTHKFDKPKNSPNSIHGLVLDRPFKVDEISADLADGAKIVSIIRSADFAEIERQFPFPFELRIIYRLKNAVLTMEIEAKNLGDGEMPIGFGIHPYFSAPLSKRSSAENCVITVPAAKFWELDQFLPTGKILDVEGEMDLRSGRSFAGMNYDDVLTDVKLENGVSRCVIDDRDLGVRLIVESDDQFRELVVYTPPNRSSICFEPYTCPTDAINLENRGISAGLIILKREETFNAMIKIFTRK